MKTCAIRNGPYQKFRLRLGSSWGAIKATVSVRREGADLNGAPPTLALARRSASIFDRERGTPRGRPRKLIIRRDLRRKNQNYPGGPLPLTSTFASRSRADQGWGSQDPRRAS